MRAELQRLKRDSESGLGAASSSTPAAAVQKRRLSRKAAFAQEKALGSVAAVSGGMVPASSGKRWMIAALATPGAASLMNSNHLPPIEKNRLVIPWCYPRDVQGFSPFRLRQRRQPGPERGLLG